MNTEQRAFHIAKACASFSEFLGSFSANDLMHWIDHELGHAQALDDFQQVSDIMTKAVAPKQLLHIISGNTPHAGLQSMLRGLLIGAHNTIKLPASDLPELHALYDQLPPELQSLCTFTFDLDTALKEANAVIAIGSDATIASIHAQLQPQQRFIPHGHKISFALIDRPSQKNAQLAAIDASLFNQQGCLSPHVIYVKENAKAFAPMLAQAMQHFSTTSPRGPISLSESGAIRDLRETLRYQAAQDPEQYALYESLGNTHWTVIYTHNPTLEISPLHRTIYVKPWCSDLSQLGDETQHLSTIALSPLPHLLKEVETLQAPRICPLGKMQHPHLFWHHDGFAPLASLVTWQDIHL